MMKRNRIFLLLLAIAACAGIMYGQTGTLSPYSRYGYGMLRDNATAAQQSMGGVGYAMNSGRQINVMNPASYARIDSLTFLFDMGIDVTNLWSNDADATGTLRSEKHTGGGLNYITMQFPLGKRMGMSIGILPYSAVGYAFGGEIDNGYTTRSGTGSINKLYVGVAGRIVGGLSLGVNASYLFGSTINDTYAVTYSGSTSLFETELSVVDWHLDAGLQYTQQIGRDALTLGFSFAPAKRIHGTLREYHYDVDADTPTDGSAVEANTETKTGHNYGQSASYGAGIAYVRPDKLLVEADFTYQPWSKVKFKGVRDVFADRFKIAAGMQYQPAVRGSYFKRAQYRAGAYFNRDYIVVGDNNVREYGASVGIGLPIPGFKSIVSVGLGYIHRQAYPTALVKEDYLNITIGVNFNEMWFRKSRIY